LKNKTSKREICYRDGKPAAVIIDIDDYQRMLEQLGDQEDLRNIRKLRKQKLASATTRRAKASLDGQSSQSFWTHTNLDELIELQGVKPITDFSELATLWPGDKDAEAFLQFILSERRARRKLIKR
jgi:PHD/YefM family antitoxin component YafN of YafNO toxin-antitoxin module